MQIFIWCWTHSTLNKYLMAGIDEQIKNKFYLNNYIFNYAVSKVTLCLKKKKTISIYSINRIKILHMQTRNESTQRERDSERGESGLRHGSKKQL